MKYRRPALLFFFLLLVSTVEAEPPTIFLVRHAEKAATGGDDMDLSDVGRARAEALASVLKDAGIAAIYTTELKRTQQTAAPIAKALHLEPAIIPAKDRAALMAKLQGASGNVFVVGHSNTIPELIKALGITTPVDIAENDYGNLFVVLPQPQTRMIRLHYR